MKTRIIRWIKKWWKRHPLSFRLIPEVGWHNHKNPQRQAAGWKGVAQ